MPPSPSEALAPSPQIAEGSSGSNSYPNPNVQGNPYIYLAVYSSVPVYEMMVRGIGVMRRRSDSFLNATQILKVAGVDKGKRTKILEKDIVMGVHEKVQGGYGRYQGTWIPFERAVELAATFGVSHLLAPLFDYTAPPPASSLGPEGSPSGITSSRYLTPGGKDSEGQSAATILAKAREQGLLPEVDASRKRAREDESLDEMRRVKVEPNGVNGSGASASGTDGRLRRSTKPVAHDASIVDDPSRTERHRAILKNVFSLEPEGQVPEAVPNLSASFPSDLDPDTAIDDHDHTALHWAAALARVSIVKALVNFGADIHRGNNVGETPLIRAVLVTNNSDHDAFARLLEVLAPSLRTVDDSGRTVLHHAALVAGVKGRAASARYYMESVLEYIARHEKGRFKELVDAQDEHGDTALNIAARVGNKALVQVLLEVGANKLKANKLGLRPGDFGIDCPELAITAGEEAVVNLQAAPIAAVVPPQKSTEVLASLTSIMSSLTADFTLEKTSKAEALERLRAQLRTATRELAEQRRQISSWREKVGELEDKAQRIRNLERALEEEDNFDWTGRTEIDGSPSVAAAGPEFTYRGPASTLSNLPAGITIEFEADPPPPANDTDQNSLVHLLRLQTWYARVMRLLRERIAKLQGGNAEQELRLQKVVAGCCGVDASRVDGMLDGLVAALESDGTGLDMARVAGFLQRVKERSEST